MLSILLVTFPFFALVLAGYIATRRGWMPLDAIGGLNAFVLYFALPCMLFRFGSSTPITRLFDAPLVLTYVIAQALLVGGVLLGTLSERIRWNDGAFGALVTAFPNTGYMGVPLLVALLGERAAGPAILTILVDLVITSSACVALSRLDTPGGAAVALKNAAKGVASNPMPWAILTGAVFSAAQLQLPAVIGKTVGLLADCASPVALFTIGAVLARGAMLAKRDASHQIPMGDYVPLALVKLVAHPLLVLCVGIGLKQLGVPVDSFSLTIITLVAALPSASNVTLLSEKFGANTARIAKVILVGTICAFLSFSGAVALLT